MKNKKGKRKEAKSVPANEEHKMVTVYYKTRSRRHPVQHWVLVRYK